MTVAVAAAVQRCPRCGTNVEQRFYGPCEACRGQLRKLEPPQADVDHFVASNRMDGAHIIVATTCRDDSCTRPGCVLARTWEPAT